MCYASFREIIILEKKHLGKKDSHMEPRSKLPILGMVIPPLIRNPYNGCVKPYYCVDEFIPYGNNGSLDPSTYGAIDVPYEKGFTKNLR